MPIDVVLDPIFAVIGVISTLLLAFALAFAMRRLLGTRVGWVRAIIVALLFQLVLFEPVRYIPQDSSLIESAQTRPFQTSLAVLAAAFWAFALAALVLVALEALIPTGSLPSIREGLFGWRGRLGRSARYAQVMAIAAKHGLAAQVRGFGAGRSDAADSKVAISLREALEEAGVTFVKLGQMLSTRPDLVPPSFLAEFSRLQTEVPAERWPAIREELERDLPRPIAECFEHVDETPLAAASVGQVHAARLRDGSEVVIKVQRPGAAAQVEQDLGILERLALSLERNAEWARRLGAVELAAGFAGSLQEELDYDVERQNMAELRAVAARTGIRVPWVVDELSSRRVLVMERFDGQPVNRAADILATWTPEERTRVARTLLAATLEQVLGDGVFHADLHAGNVVVWPDGRLGLLDFGAVGRLDAIARRELGRLLWAVDVDDPAVATDALLMLLDEPEGLDERALRRRVGELLTRVRAHGGAGGVSGLFTRLFHLVVAAELGVPASVAAALRSVAAIEGTATLIDPRLDLVESARAAGRQAVRDLDPKRLPEELAKHAMRMLPSLERLPRRLDRVAQDLERGEFTMRVRMLAHEDDRRYFRSVVSEIVMALLAVGAFIGGLVLVTSTGGPDLLPGLRLNVVIGAFAALLGFVLALRCLALVFSRHRT